MIGADYLFVIVLAISLVIGCVRGFIRETVSLLTWLVGTWLAWHYGHLVYPWLGGVLTQPGVQEWVGRGIVLFAVVLFGMLIGAIVAHVAYRAAGLGITDRLLGGVFGMVRGAVLIGLFVIAGRAVQLEEVPWWKGSRMMPVAEAAANWLERYAQPVAADLLEQAARPPGS